MDLLSIAAPSAEVTIGPGEGQTISVRGVTLRDLAALMARFPDLLALFNGRELDASRLLAAAPDAAAAIMAAGAGHPNDPRAEAVCDALGLQAQCDLLMKIIELTFPAGLGPFVAAMEHLSSTLPGPAKANGAAQDHAPQAMT